MSNKNQLRDSLQKESQQSKRSFWRSKAYHRFFEGYSEVAIPASNGNGDKIERIYTGNYFRQDLTKGQRILLRVLYVSLFLGSAYLFVTSASLPLASNSMWYVVLSQVVSVPFLFWIIIAFFSYLPAGQDMTVNEYRSSSLALQKATLGSAICLGITALVTLVFILLNLSTEPKVELLCAVKYVVSGLLVLSINRVEKKVNYLIIPSQNPFPVDAIEIK